MLRGALTADGTGRCREESVGRGHQGGVAHIEAGRTRLSLNVGVAERGVEVAVGLQVQLELHTASFDLSDLTRDRVLVGTGLLEQGEINVAMAIQEAALGTDLKQLGLSVEATGRELGRALCGDTAAIADRTGRVLAPVVGRVTRPRGLELVHRAGVRVEHTHGRGVARDPAGRIHVVGEHHVFAHAGQETELVGDLQVMLPVGTDLPGFADAGVAVDRHEVAIGPSGDRSEVPSLVEVIGVVDVDVVPVLGDVPNTGRFVEEVVVRFDLLVAHRETGVDAVLLARVARLRAIFQREAGVDDFGVVVRGHRLAPDVAEERVVHELPIAAGLDGLHHLGVVAHALGVIARTQHAETAVEGHLRPEFDLVDRREPRSHVLRVLGVGG